MIDQSNQSHNSPNPSPSNPKRNDNKQPAQTDKHFVLNDDDYDDANEYAMTDNNYQLKKS